MKTSKRTRLETRGWRVGSMEEFLNLSPAEVAFIDLKFSLCESVRERRLAQNISQAGLAKRLSSSQSRVAKMEAADASVSIDLLLRALLELGAKPRDIAAVIQKRKYRVAKAS
jgi:ribosome-binding protein aMBF1 (putative translation factor)